MVFELQQKISLPEPMPFAFPDCLGGVSGTTSKEESDTKAFWHIGTRWSQQESDPIDAERQ